MISLIKNKNILTIIISFIIIVILFVCGPFLWILNKTLQNKYYSIKNDIVGLKANTHIIVVDIDERSFSEIWKFPFSRWVYAQVLNNIEKYNVWVVALDILFLDPSWNDEAFIAALANDTRVVLWSAFDSGRNILRPFDEIPVWSYKTWYLHPNVEKSNKTVYSFSPQIVASDNETYEHFSIQILRSFYEYLYAGSIDIPELGEYSDSQYIFSPDTHYPLASSHSNEILINFIPGESFTRISFADLYDETKLSVINRKIGLKDTILLIGPAAEWLKDEFFTPNGTEYGVNIHANILNTLLSKQYMMYFDKRLEWVLIFFLIVLSVSANLSSSNRVIFASNIAIVLVFWFVFPLSILLGTNLILNHPSEIIFSLLLAFTASNIVKYLIEDKNKRKLNRALSEYVGSSIADEILLEHGKVNLDGEKKELVMFFSDIEGFTTMSEKLDPEELVTFLREYLGEMTKIIMEEHGHVDKYEWDAIMALWGAFHTLEVSDYHTACSSALRQQKALSEINTNWKTKFQKDVAVRMWIHEGEAIVGNIGAVGQKMEFTALWDNVNLASRLEGVNKFYGTYICVSEAIYKETKDVFSYRYLDIIQVKGKDVPVKIYELRGYISEMTDSDHRLIESFEAALETYRSRDFTQAKKLFWALAKTDAPSKVYEERCQSYIDTPPEEDWNGVWRMTEK